MTGTFRYTSPEPPRAATGVVADVYAQLATDFGIDRATTFVVLSASPPLLVSTWAVMRESLLAGQASRTGKEVVAAGVSLANRCPYCVTAHTVLLHATGDHTLAERIARGEQPEDPEHRQLLAWGKDMSKSQPFPSGQAPEYIGTALAFHFINRIVLSLLTEDMLPGGAQKYRLVRSVAGRSLARTVRRELVPGESLALLETQEAAPGGRRTPRSAPRSARCVRRRTWVRGCSVTRTRSWYGHRWRPGTASHRSPCRVTGCRTGRSGRVHGWRCSRRAPRTGSRTRTWRPGKHRRSPITAWFI